MFSIEKSPQESVIYFYLIIVNPIYKSSIKKGTTIYYVFKHAPIIHNGHVMYASKYTHYCIEKT